MGRKERHVPITQRGRTLKAKPIWRFNMVDRHGPFAFTLSRSDFDHKEVLGKLMAFFAKEKSFSTHS